MGHLSPGKDLSSRSLYLDHHFYIVYLVEIFFDENIPRILHEGQGIEIREGSWEILPIFSFLEKYGKVAHREMFNIFNMGIGMVLALDASEADKAIGILEGHGEKASVIGRITDGQGVTII